VYDYVIPVSRIRNGRPANLDLMNRPDLHSAFTKINLWKQTQFRKIVYIDADVVAYRAPDELFDLPHAFSAAPDIGWPDLFNTGVMVLTPNIGDYHALMALAERGISFDGADQGLLNIYFQNSFNRLSFTYNVTPSAHYQYVPAYKHFQSSINMVHFIGANKPWLEGRDKSTGSSPYDEMMGRWWAVYDRHYRREVSFQTVVPAELSSLTNGVRRGPNLNRSQDPLRLCSILSRVNTSRRSAMSSLLASHLMINPTTSTVSNTNHHKPSHMATCNTTTNSSLMPASFIPLLSSIRMIIITTSIIMNLTITNPTPTMFNLMLKVPLNRFNPWVLLRAFPMSPPCTLKGHMLRLAKIRHRIATSGTRPLPLSRRVNRSANRNLSLRTHQVGMLNG
jgi:hypothetical protein